MQGIQSPLRYPGSKAALGIYLEDFLSENLLLGCDFYEAFAGGASLSLQLIEKGMIRKATLIEKDPLLYSFWKCIKTKPNYLKQKLEKTDVTFQTWLLMRNYLSYDSPRNSELVEMALACIFLNRTCFSGIIHAGPIGGREQKSKYAINCRFNKERLLSVIDSISSLTNRINVVYGDAVRYLRKNRKKLLSRDCLVYIDPPYYQQGSKLYRYHFRQQDHQSLADFIRLQEYPWLVSYDDDPAICEMFKGNRILSLYLNYAVKQARNARELLISNLPLPLSDCRYRASSKDINASVS